MIIHPIESFFGCAGAIVISPTPDDGIEGRDQGGLRIAPVGADLILELEQMPFLGFLAGFDDRLETRFSPIGAGTIFRSRELPNGKTEKIEPCRAFVFVKGVTDVGFTRFEPLLTRFQPVLGVPAVFSGLRG